MRAVDLFCGAGGLSLGLSMAGFRVGLGVDMSPHACATHEENLGREGGATWRRDARGVSGAAVRELLGGGPDLLAGGPNCQGVSAAGLRDPADPRNGMFAEFARLVDELRPPAVLMENVAGLAHRKNRPILEQVFRTLLGMGYSVGADVVQAADHGVAQMRFRLILVALRGDEPVLFPAPSRSRTGEGGLPRWLTVGEAISDLPPVPAGGGQDVSEYGGPALNEWQAAAREGAEALFDHRSAATEGVNIARVAAIPEGGNWKDIPPGLLPTRFLRVRMTDNSVSYGRLRRDHPSWTLTTLFGNVTAGAFTHPLQDRALTVREGARLHGFPDRFRFLGPLAQRYRQIGNAVPPPLARAFGRHILRRLGDGAWPADSVRPRLDAATVLGGRPFPVLAPRYPDLFGSATRWPLGWGPEPQDRRQALDANYRLMP